MEFVADYPPAQVAASVKKCQLIVHDLSAKCPFVKRPIKESNYTLQSKSILNTVHTKLGTIIPHDQSLQEHDPNYVPFGCGSRRCTGEWLTYKFILTASKWEKINRPGLPTGEYTMLGIQRVSIVKCSSVI